MKALKLIKLFSRLVVAFVKLMMKLLVVFTLLAFIFGIKASLVITLILAVLISLIFINNLFSVMTEGQPRYHTRKKAKSNYYADDDHWVPGEPAVTPKAYEQGFFYDHDD